MKRLLPTQECQIEAIRSCHWSMLVVLSVFEIVTYAVCDRVVSETFLVMLKVVGRGGHTHSPERPGTALRVMHARRGFAST